jgi:mono/diheme cytochrome c family protein
MLLACATVLPLLAGCTRDFRFQPVSMWNESRLKPFEPSPMSDSGSIARMPPIGSVARGELHKKDPLYAGRQGKALLTKSPIPVTPEMLQRGQERFNTFCSPCHGLIGDGSGMIVQRGFPHPPDYALKRLHDAPIGHIYDVQTNGYGVMFSYAERVPVTDRWAIAAYVRVLQSRRPAITKDEFAEERERARQQGIVDPVRGMRLPAEGGESAAPAGGGEGAHGAEGAEPETPRIESELKAPAPGHQPAPQGLGAH